MHRGSTTNPVSQTRQDKRGVMKHFDRGRKPDRNPIAPTHGPKSPGKSRFQNSFFTALPRPWPGWRIPWLTVIQRESSNRPERFHQVQPPDHQWKSSNESSQSWAQPM